MRRTAIASLSVAVVSRAVLTFGRSREALLLALVGLSPFGEAVLSTGIYTVALKKLTTPATRGFAFGVQCAYISPVSPLYLAYISPISRLYLAYISPISHQARRARSSTSRCRTARPSSRRSTAACAA